MRRRFHFRRSTPPSVRSLTRRSSTPAPVLRSPKIVGSLVEAPFPKLLPASDQELHRSRGRHMLAVNLRILPMPFVAACNRIGRKHRKPTLFVSQFFLREWCFLIGFHRHFTPP